MSLAALRQQIATVIAGTPSGSPGLPTGMAALDSILPGGGIPAGRITEFLAPLGFGKTTIARSLVLATITSGRYVAWIDATRTLDPRDFLAAGASGQEGPSIDLDALWVVRPLDPARAPWCADLVLRTGAFALVVLDGAPLLPRVVAVRLTQLAREADAAFLLMGEGTRASEIGGSLRLVMRRREVVTVEKGGSHQQVHLRLKDPEGRTRDDITRTNVAHRLCAHPEIPDRRGVGGSHGGKTISRARRFAQPEYPRR